MKAVRSYQVWMYQWRCPDCGCLNHEQNPHGNDKHLASCRACPAVVHIRFCKYDNDAVSKSAANYDFAGDAV